MSKSAELGAPQAADVVEQAIARLSLSITFATGITHHVDESKAKSLFKALVKKQIPFNGESIYLLAIKQGWTEKHATSLSKLADQIGSGGRVQIKYPTDWGELVLNQIFNKE